MKPPHVVLVDNYDSFTHNLAHGLAIAGGRVTVVRNDAVDRVGVEALKPDALALSPGPGHPAVARDFGVCAELVHNPLPVPMLGVCLGMQGMAHYTGGHVVAAPDVVHGEASPVRLQAGHPLFRGLPQTIDVGRYHSLVVDPGRLPPEWQPIATGDGGLLMAMAHRHRPWIGVQFHPESILTPQGPRILQNFLEMTLDRPSPGDQP